MTDINKHLATLKLAGIAKSLEIRNQFALENQLSYIDFLKLLIEDELTNRQTNSFKHRFQKSKLNTDKTIDSYDFTYQPKLDKKLIRDLAAGQYIQKASNIILMGPPGVGKTHIANALGIEAVKQGYKVLFIHASEVIERLFSAKGDGSYATQLKTMVSADVLIIDELGFKKINLQGVDDFFEVIRQRYEVKPIILTTNRSFEDWGAIFGDQVLASAIIDRLIHHSHVVKITGKSYRTKELAEVKPADN
ncbi:MAG: AAA family ATPase [Candidatus Aenigmatarchaeota archaeon]|nr:MAG: AAA family ATPase [Candidatus Aenigmarchaeota archaeon]